ncbi:TonB-dependent receptor plug domain-containing protein [Pelagicoccus mobilis]|uniref:TonB-dependent receptor n=1 Tax=Pelagicoccus mobilis TaxID=415221 RepID=A0A934RYV4_9BACT|nr:TonB-dependent receptor [Pelagicoccus mobilis]MBK1876852.1 TonB-dependent receptor [Pelagicoccus mobilis]
MPSPLANSPLPPSRSRRAVYQACASLAAALLHSSLQAEEDLFDLTLEELLNVQVIVASDRLEDERSVFGSVDRIQEPEWQRFGATLAFDALNYVSGVDTHLSIGGSTTLSIRGYSDSTGSARGKALLFDGIPLNGFTFATDLYGKSLLSSQMLESIEIVKGPISSFYGPGAFHGAILLRPWKSESDTRQFHASIGTREDYEATFRASYDLGGGIRSTTNLNYFSQSAAGPYAPTAGRAYDYELESKSLNQTFQYENHRIGILLNKSTTDDFYDLFDADGYSRANPASARLFYYRSDLDLGNDLTLKPSVWHNDSRFDLESRNGQVFLEWEDKATGGKLHLEHEQDQRLLKAGIEFIHMSIPHSQLQSAGSPATSPYDGFSRDISTLFASYTDSFLDERLALDLGLRYDHFSNTDANELSPKFGVIYHLDQQNSLKLIAASGYRAPAAGEIAGGNAFLGGTALEGERLNSYELIHIFTNENFTLNNTFFTNKWKDAIITQETDASRNAGLAAQFVNAGRNESYGYELEATYLQDNLNTLVFLNASHVRSRNSDSDALYELFPETKLALGLRYEGDTWDASLTTLHKFDRKSSPLPEARDLPDYHSINLGIRYKADAFSIDLNIDNLFDRTNIEPSIWSIPGGIYQTGTEARLSFRSQY